MLITVGFVVAERILYIPRWVQVYPIYSVAAPKGGMGVPLAPSQEKMAKNQTFAANFCIFVSLPQTPWMPLRKKFWCRQCIYFKVDITFNALSWNCFPDITHDLCILTTTSVGLNVYTFVILYCKLIYVSSHILVFTSSVLFMSKHFWLLSFKLWMCLLFYVHKFTFQNFFVIKKKLKVSTTTLADPIGACLFSCKFMFLLN